MKVERPTTDTPAREGRRDGRDFFGTTVGFLAVGVFLSMMLLQVGCLDRGSYVTFKQPDFSYEYPRGWATNVEEYPNFLHTETWDSKVSDNGSPVKVFVNVRLGLGATAEQEARDTLSQRILSNSGERNFDLIKQESITLDGAAGHQTEYTLDAVSSYDVIPEKRFYIPTRVIDISVSRGGNVYEVEISASQNEWDAHANDVRHVLGTFRWR